MTARQQQALDIIRRSYDERGEAPTIREIGKEMGIRSPEGVVGHLRALQRQGYITRHGRRARGIRLTEPTRCRLCGQLKGVTK
jgi:repressor LexA